MRQPRPATLTILRLQRSLYAAAVVLGATAMKKDRSRLDAAAISDAVTEKLITIVTAVHHSYCYAHSIVSICDGHNHHH